MCQSVHRMLAVSLAAFSAAEVCQSVCPAAVSSAACQAYLRLLYVLPFDPCAVALACTPQFVSSFLNLFHALGREFRRILFFLFLFADRLTQVSPCIL